ncbi:MAG: hypothetical protein E6G56_14180 [Actinobacteria bacterium]|nr:MAG: hypothetical protein E6G56_14180 [Actinomycetota bacterium]
MASAEFSESLRRQDPMPSSAAAPLAVAHDAEWRESQPDMRTLRGNGQLEEGDLQRGEDKLARVLGW